MLGTVLDASEGSALRTLRESFALVGSGLRTHANLAAEAGTGRLAANVCAQGATVYGLVLVIALLHFDRLIIDHPGGIVEQETTVISIQVLLVMAIAAALIGYDRIAALFGLAWVAVDLQAVVARPAWPGDSSSTGVVHSLAPLLVPLACYSVMLIAPRVRPRSARRLAWLALVLLLGLAVSPYFQGPAYGMGLTETVQLTLLLAGLFFLPAGPSLPLAFALALFAHGLSLWTFPGGYPLSGAQCLLTVAGPIVLSAGAGVTLVSARRGVAS